jgi:p24 family protein beta-1
MYVSEDEHMAPVEREIRALAQGLQAVQDEQEYIVVRERVHRNTAESTNERIMWWSICQSILLIVVCAWQVYYLKVRASFNLLSHWLTAPPLQSFFEVKRVI